MSSTFIHPTAVIEDNTVIGENTKVWHNAQIRRGASLGKNCIIGKDVFIDAEVKVGNNCKIQNRVSVYHGVTIEDGVFVGPHVCFTNDKIPRAINADGTPKNTEDWTVSKTLIKKGASIGANATILCGITLGQFCLAGAGSVVTKNIPDFGLVVGNPARVVGFVCRCGKTILKSKGMLECKSCKTKEKCSL